MKKAALMSGLFAATRSQSGFMNSVDRTDRHAVRAITLIFAFVAGALVDYVDITLRDRIGRALGQTETACRAILIDLHCHNRDSF